MSPLTYLFACAQVEILVVDAYNKSEVSSFNRSKDIWVRILTIWAASAILDSILSEF